MIVPLWVVAIAFTVAVLFCVIDFFLAKNVHGKVLRSSQSIVLGFASFYYWQAAAFDTIPASDLRVVWISLCIVNCAEIISRWEFPKKRKNYEH